MLYRKARLGWSTGPSKYWVMSIDGTPMPSGASYSSTRIKLGADGNLWYAKDEGGYGTNDDAYLLSIQANDIYDFGTVLSEYDLSTTFSECGIFDMWEEGDYLYLALGTDESSQRYRPLVAKVDKSTMAIQWDYYINGDPRINVGQTTTKIALDSSENVHVAGNTGAPGTCIIYKLNSGGTKQWYYELPTTPDSEFPTIVSTGNDGNIYVSIDNSNNSESEITVLKISSATPAITWQRRVYPSSGTVNFQRVFLAVDASDNIFALFGTSASQFLVKWNSSGSLQWSRSISNANGSSSGGLGVDSDGNSYIAVSDTTDDLVQVLKFNSSGAAQWKKRISPPSGETVFVANDLIVDSTNDIMYVVAVGAAKEIDYLCALAFEDEVDYGIALEVTVDGTSIYTVGTSPSITEAAGALSLSAGSGDGLLDSSLAISSSTHFTTDRDLL